MPVVRSVRAIVTNPAGQNLVVVRVETNEPGLHGLGCATFTQRHRAVVEVVQHYLDPLLRGRPVENIRELWRLMHTNGYWRHSPVLNNAISGVDQALWDIKGKVAGLPVYELLGGKVREAAVVYRHANGDTAENLLESAQHLVASGLTHLRVQLSGYVGSGSRQPRPDGARDGIYFDPTRYQREMLEALDVLRPALPPDLELIHDIHSRLSPADAINFARRLEPYRLFFLEDALPPEQLDGYERLRQATTTRLAVGELFVHPAEWVPLVAHRRIDFLRLHISAVGGLTPAWQAATLCESFGVRTAWHGPGDVSPVGHAANLHLDLASFAFGVQEFVPFTDQARAVFDGLPELRGAYLYPSDRPGLGVEMDEAAAARFPPSDQVIDWTQLRLPDGSLTLP